MQRVLREVWSTVRALSWGGILVAALAVALLTREFFALATFSYADHYQLILRTEPSDAHGAQIAYLAATHGARAFFVIATVLSVRYLAVWAAEKPLAHGPPTGVLAAAGFQTIHLFFYEGVVPIEAAIYLALGIAGGVLGGAWGRRDLFKREALYRATRRMGKSAETPDPDALAAIVGEEIAGKDVSFIGLWRAVRAQLDDGTEGPAETFDLWGAWAPAGEEAWSPDARLDAKGLSALARLGEERSVWVRADDLHQPERAIWLRRGTKSALFVPLGGAGEQAPFEIMMVAFRNRRRRPSRGVTRDYLTVAAQASLARRVGELETHRRLARDIHDTQVQGFTAVRFNLAAIDAEQLPGPARVKVEDAYEAAIAGETEGRRLMKAEEAQGWDSADLYELLGRLARRWSAETGTEVRLEEPVGEPRPLAPAVVTVLQRVVQEGLSNVRKHAKASRVTLDLAFDPGFATLQIEDDGVGFDAASQRSAGGHGLRGMRERAEELGGSLRVLSTPGRGTRLLVWVPTGHREPEPLRESLAAATTGGRREGDAEEKGKHA